MIDVPGVIKSEAQLCGQGSHSIPSTASCHIWQGHSAWLQGYQGILHRLFVKVDRQEVRSGLIFQDSLASFQSLCEMVAFFLFHWQAFPAMKGLILLIQLYMQQRTVTEIGAFANWYSYILQGKMAPRTSWLNQKPSSRMKKKKLLAGMGLGTWARHEDPFPCCKGPLSSKPLGCQQFKPASWVEPARVGSQWQGDRVTMLCDQVCHQ